MAHSKKDSRFIPWKSTTERESKVKLKKKKKKGSNQDPNIQTMIFKSSIWPSEQPGLMQRGRHLLKVKIKHDNKALGTMQDPE